MALEESRKSSKLQIGLTAATSQTAPPACWCLQDLMPGLFLLEVPDAIFNGFSISFDGLQHGSFTETLLSKLKRSLERNVKNALFLGGSHLLGGPFHSNS